jgi:hypothetical protein
MVLTSHKYHDAQLLQVFAKVYCHLHYFGEEALKFYPELLIKNVIF